MIAEDYVSFEVAKLLKEKGFNEPCECAYSSGGQYLLSCYKGIVDRRIKNDEASDFSYSSTAPTHQMAMKWLREVHNIAIDTEWEHLWYVYVKPMTANPFEDDYCQCFSAKYEEAVEAALKYSLENLI